MQMNARPADIKWMLIQTIATSMWFDKHTSQQDTACEKKTVPCTPSEKPCKATSLPSSAAMWFLPVGKQQKWFANTQEPSHMWEQTWTRKPKKQRPLLLITNHCNVIHTNSDVSQKFESRNKHNVNRNHKCWMLTKSHWTKRLCHHRTLWTSV